VSTVVVVASIVAVVAVIVWMLVTKRPDGRRRDAVQRRPADPDAEPQAVVEPGEVAPAPRPEQNRDRGL
jgi:hypothetical protein